VKAGTSADKLATAIRNGTIIDHVQYHTAHTGDTIFMPAGTLHALGPGFLVYEVQQTSNITYRIFDWNRPASAGRALHLEQSVAVTNPQGTGRLQPVADLHPDDRRELVRCPYFTLELLTAHTQPLSLDTRGASFHALTVIEGQGAIECGDERLTLKQFETVLVAASAGAYHLNPIGSARILKASVE
jgi:mannose-6-phosphate isomerase